MIIALQSREFADRRSAMLELKQKIWVKYIMLYWI